MRLIGISIISFMLLSGCTTVTKQTNYAEDLQQQNFKLTEIDTNHYRLVYQANRGNATHRAAKIGLFHILEFAEMHKMRYIDMHSAQIKRGFDLQPLAENSYLYGVTEARFYQQGEFLPKHYQVIFDFNLSKSPSEHSMDMVEYRLLLENYIKNQ